MDRDKLIELLERFEEIKAEMKSSKSEICVVLNIITYSSGEWSHYLFVLDRKSGVNFIVKIKGFNGMSIVDNIETFDDILKEFEAKAV